MDSGKKADLQEVKKAINILFEPGQVVEIRVPGKFGATSGFFDDHEKLAQAVKQLSDQGGYDGVYYTLNPCHEALLARRDRNKLHEGVKETTSDGEITRRRWLLIDFDPKRPKGVSATNEEKRLAKSLMLKVAKALRKLGWPLPVIAVSGNGYHLLYRVDEPNDSETIQLFKQCLKAMAEKFGTGQVEIDQKVFNASRITKAYGSLAAKGVNTEDRPHRYSKILHVPEEVKAVSRTQLESMTAKPLAEKPRNGGGITPSKVEEFLTWGAISFKSSSEMPGGGIKWELEECPFNPEHRNASVHLSSAGVLGFHCFHTSCGEYHWEQFRGIVEEKKGEKFLFAENSRRADYWRWNGGKVGEGAAKFEKRPLAVVRKDIEMLLYAPRKGTNLPPIAQAPSIVTDLIWADLNGRGKFFRDASRDLAFLCLGEKEPGTSVPKVLEISDNHWFAAMLDEYYGIHIADPVAGRIIAQLENRTMTARGQKYPVHELGQYDAKKNQLFLCVGEEIILIEPDNMKVVQNGYDDRFFVANERFTPVDANAVIEVASRMDGWLFGLDVDPETPLVEYLFKNVPFEKEGALTPEQAAQAVLAGVLSLPFGDAIGEKPVFYFIGDEDCGKTHLCRKIGYLLYGTGWDVVSMGEEQRDFQTSLVRNYLLCVDDVEEDTKDAKANAKKLCRCATGGHVSFRVMRSDAKEKKLPFTAWVWISGLSLFNHAPDFLSRLITISFRGELPRERQGRAELQQFLAENRVALLGDYVKRLQRILKGIAADGGSAHGIGFRMADWVKIIGPAARDGGLLTEFVDLFNAIKGDRLMDAENDPLMKPIRALFADKPELNGKEMRIDVLEAELKAVAEEHKFSVYCLNDPHIACTWALSRGLTKLSKVLLCKEYGFKDRRYRPRGQTHEVRHVTFNIPEQVMENIKRWALEYGKAAGDWRWKNAAMK